MKTLSGPTYLSPLTWKFMLAVADFLLDVTFCTILLTEILVIITMSVFPALSSYLGFKPEPRREKVGHAGRPTPE